MLTQYTKVAHGLDPMQYQNNYFKVNSKITSIILYSFINVYIYFTNLTRNEYIIDSYSNRELLKMIVLSVGKRAQALSSLQFPNPLPVNSNDVDTSQFELERSERC